MATSTIRSVGVLVVCAVAHMLLLNVFATGVPVVDASLSPSESKLSSSAAVPSSESSSSVQLNSLHDHIKTRSSADEKLGTEAAVGQDHPEWDVKQQTENIELSRDKQGLLRVARHKGTYYGPHSVLASHALSAPSSSSSPSSTSSSVVGFEVRIDRQTGLGSFLHVGVSSVLPSGIRSVGDHGYGVCIGAEGRIKRHGLTIQRIDPFDTDAVIRVEWDATAQTISFYINGKLQYKPVPMQGLINQPFYPAVTLYYPDQQVSLL